MRAVVTGGAGFLGSWLCERLLADGAEVYCIDNVLTGQWSNLAGLPRERLHLIEADVADGLPSLDGVDLVVHLASPASPRHYTRHPIATLRAGSLGTHHAIGLAQRNGARFVLASTSEVYGDPEVSPQPEEYWGRVNPIGPRSVYDEAKRYAEALTYAHVRENGLDGGAVRIFNTYGPRMGLADGRVVTTLVAQALRGEPLTIFGDGSQTRSFCFVTDTIDGIVAFARSSCSGPINIGNDHEISINALADLIRSVCGSTSPVQHRSLPVDDPGRRCPDLTRAGALLGWAPAVPIEVGLERTARWVATRLNGRVWPGAARMQRGRAGYEVGIRARPKEESR